MNSPLPSTGTAELLEQISEYIPDDFINDLFPRHVGPGRRSRFSAAQLWRVHLLSVLTPVHAFNLLVEMLPEQRAWRTFARLPNRQSVPDVWMLHQFRQRAGVSGLRQINTHLVEPLLPLRSSTRISVALIDATDLPAACSGHKKSELDNGRRNTPPWARARLRPDKASSFSATKSILFASGCRTIRAACC